MNISTRLSLAAGACVAVVIAIVAVAVTTTWNVRREVARNGAAEEIVNAVTSIRYLTLDYSLQHEPRAVVQWHRAHQALAQVLERSRTTLGGDRAVVERLRQANATVGPLFGELVGNRPDLLGDPARRVVAEELEERLTGRIVVRLEMMIGDARALADESRARVLVAQRRAMLTIIGLGGVIVLLVGIAVPLPFRDVGRRLAALREGTAVLGAGDLGVRLAVRSQDEIGALAGAFNVMADRLERDGAERRRAEDALERTRTELAHVARVGALGQLTASIAHEINQPLGAIVNNANASLRWMAADNVPEARSSAALVVGDGHRASEILARIRAMVRKAPPHRERLDVNGAVREVLALTARQAREQGIAVESHLADDVPRVHADRVQVQQVVLNLVVNAIEAEACEPPAAARRVTVTSCVTGGADGAAVRVSVRDEAAGVGPVQLDRVFEPFYSTKPDGLGMGLAISRGIVEDHGGTLWATANDDRGTTFHFTLPVPEDGER